MNMQVQTLSGGELQRFAIACTAVRDADVYMSLLQADLITRPFSNPISIA